MAWTEGHENTRFKRYVTLQESLTVPDSGGASEASISSSTIEYDLSDRDFLIFVDITEASAGNGSLDAKLQASVDDSNWVDVDTSAGLSIDTTGTNSGSGFLDVGDKQAPYWRVVLFTDGTDTQDSMDADITIAFKG